MAIKWKPESECCWNLKKQTKKPHPPLPLMGARAGPLMNKPHEWKSLETDCFALLHMSMTSGEDVDPFLCFLQSGPTCQLDVCVCSGESKIPLCGARRQRRARGFIVRCASASSQPSSNIPPKYGTLQAKTEAVEEGKHDFSFQG